MGIEALRSAVEQEAHARIAALLDEARSRARALREEAASAVAARQRERLRDEETALRRAAAARIAAARSGAQRRVLTAREGLIDEIFSRARRAAPSETGSAAAREGMVRLAERALDYLPPGPAVIECAPALAPDLERGLAHRGVRVAPEPAISCGFRARDEAGAVVVDGTLATLLALHRPALAIELLARLDPEPPR